MNLIGDSSSDCNISIISGLSEETQVKMENANQANVDQDNPVQGNKPNGNQAQVNQALAGFVQQESKKIEKMVNVFFILLCLF